MPRNYDSQYRPRTYACYTAAVDDPVAVSVLGVAVHVLAIVPSRALMLSRVTRVGWNMKVSSGSFVVRLIEIVSAVGGVFTPATRRTRVIASLTTAHEGAAVVVVPAAGAPRFGSWVTNAGGSRIAHMVEQGNVLENPIELAAGRGLAIEVETLTAGLADVMGYFDWEEFQ